ncbi:hypothetical protein AMECASPLE_005837 [Ameca splendens]|uniref:Uncharacterized protein n=1 Tax=Ameca splendens TaxID=208324 RepID=A0ABV0YYY2_9TELE
MHSTGKKSKCQNYSRPTNQEKIGQFCPVADVFVQKSFNCTLTQRICTVSSFCLSSPLGRRCQSDTLSEAMSKNVMQNRQEATRDFKQYINMREESKSINIHLKRASDMFFINPVTGRSGKLLSSFSNAAQLCAHSFILSQLNQQPQFTTITQ